MLSRCDSTSFYTGGANQFLNPEHHLSVPGTEQLLEPNVSRKGGHHVGKRRRAGGPAPGALVSGDGESLVGERHAGRRVRETHGEWKQKQRPKVGKLRLCQSHQNEDWESVLS